MIETISYRATRHLPKQVEHRNENKTVIGVNDILIKLSCLPTEPLAKETMLIIELTKEENDVDRIIKLILDMDNNFDETIIQNTYKILETKDIKIVKDFVKKLQVSIIKIPTVWDKYNKDMLFSIKVSRYYEQLEILINARPV